MFSSIEDAEKQRNALIPRYKEILQIFTDKKKGDKHKYFAWKASRQATDLTEELEIIKTKLELSKKYINDHRPAFTLDHDTIISQLVDALFRETKLAGNTGTPETRKIVGEAVRYLKSRPTQRPPDVGVRWRKKIRLRNPHAGNASR